MNLFTEKEAIDTLILIIEALGSVMILMIGGLSYFIVSTARMISKRIDKQEDLTEKKFEKQDEFNVRLANFMRDQQKQITDLHNKLNKTVELIGTNQENDREQMGFLKDLVLQTVRK